MTNPLDKIKKLKGRSWDEIRTRGKQTISGYSEQMGFGGNIPSDEELRGLFSKSEFSDGIITSEVLLKKFYENGNRSFFPSVLEKDKTIKVFRDSFGDETEDFFIRKADKICEGKIDLLGFSDLEIGEAVDWHYEPLAEKQSPLQHWKKFDEQDTSETGDLKIIWELNRHQHFFTLGVAYLLTKDEKYAAAFVRHLGSWMDQNPPGMGVNWVSSLEISLRVISWVWAFHFFKDSISFTSGFYQKVLKYLFLQATHLEQYLSTYYSPNTHLTGEALGLFYLGTQFPFFERAKHWKSIGEKILLDELDRQVLPDGVYFEQSTWYQRYTADFYLQFIILQKLSGDSLDSRAQEKLNSKVQKLLDFLMCVTQPDGTTPIVGDDDGGRCIPLTDSMPNDFRGTLAVGSVAFRRGDYKYVAEGLSQEIIWLFGGEGANFFEIVEAHYPEKNSCGFRDGGYFVMRDGWSKTDNFLMVDAGEVGSLKGGHGHADTLAIQLAVGGKTLLVDPGTYTYHKSKELRDSFRSSLAHNTLSVDEKSSSQFGSKFSWETRADARLNSWVTQDRFDFFEGSHDGYKQLENSPVEHTRSILFLKNDYWIMRDFVNTSGKHSYQQNFHFDEKTNPVLENGDKNPKRVYEIDENGVGLGLFTFGDNGEWQRKEGWISNNYGERRNAPLIRFNSKGVGPQEFFTFMIPSEAGFAKPEVIETTVLNGRAFVINYRDYQDLFVFADGNGQLVRTEIFNTDFSFFWARLSKSDELPEEFVLINGKNFTLGDRLVIKDPNKLDFAIARRFGKKLHVRTSKDLFSVSIPTSKNKSYIVKNTHEF